MQNYLQSKPLRKIAAVIIFVVIITLAALLIMPWNNKDNGVYGHNMPSDTLYLSSFDAKTPKSITESIEIKQSENVEMNNNDAEVAKIYQNTDNSQTLGDITAQNVLVLMSDGRVESMSLEDYVTGCVLGEMPLSFEVQALMAQSVAIRSFTVRKKFYGSKHRNADVCTNPACCQCYVSPEDIRLSTDGKEKLYDAVSATKGIILIYDGTPIEAVYHASSGKSTLNSEDVWGGRVEYLRSVKSPDGEEAISASGMGHRVGMSQHGANILAGDGFNYMQILKYYYNGVSFGFLK